MTLSIIVPVYNEQELVVTLLGKLLALSLDHGMSKEIIVIDDGSTDGTLANVKEWLGANEAAGVTLLTHGHNRGKGAAVRTGIAAATGQIVIIQDADLEYDPEDIIDVCRPIVTGKSKVVYGSRILREKANATSGICGLFTGKHPHSYPLAYLGGVAITWWINLLTGADLTDEPTCYKCFHRSALAGLTIESEGFDWEPEVTVKLLRRGYEIMEVPISYHPRKKAEGKKICWKDGVTALWTALRHRIA